MNENESSSGIPIFIIVILFALVLTFAGLHFVIANSRIITVVKQGEVLLDTSSAQELIRVKNGGYVEDDRSIVCAESGSTVVATNHSRVYAESGARVYALEGATVYVQEGAKVHFQTSATIYAHPNANLGAYAQMPNVHIETNIATCP